MLTNHRSRARGVTLIVVLIILVIVTIVGIAGARIALLGERSTRSDRDYQIAWEAAEAALIDAENDIQGPISSRKTVFGSTDVGTQSSLFVDGCGTTGVSVGLCSPAAPGQLAVWQPNSGFNFVNEAGTPGFVVYGAITGRTFPASSSGIAPAQKPHYIIECCIVDTRFGNSVKLGDPKNIIYRITAIGFGPNLQTQVMMQSTYAKDPNL